MITGILNHADAEVITRLTASLEVLQVGCWQGHDTAALARGARRVVTIGQCQGLDHTGFMSQVSMWGTIQRFYTVADHTLILPGDVPSLLSTFTPGQFEVAVLDLAALGGPDPHVMLNMVRLVAERVIVIPALHQQMQSCAAAFAEAGDTVTQYGRVWAFEPGPAKDQDESKDEG